MAADVLEDPRLTEEQRSRLRDLRRRHHAGNPLTPADRSFLDSLPQIVEPPPASAPKSTSEAPMSKPKKAPARKRPTPTRHRPANKGELNKLQRKAKAELDRAERGEGDRKAGRRATKPKRSLAYRAAHKIRAKHKILRPVVYTTVGATVLVGKTVKVAGIGASKATKWGSAKLVSRIKADVHKRKWVPEAQRPRSQRFKRTIDVTCCDKHFTTIEGLNTHAVEAHRGEARQKVPMPRIQRGHTRKTAGKVLVRPVVAGGGRHRARHNIPDARRADQLVAAYRVQLDKIGEKVMAAESTANRLVQAAKIFADTPKPRSLAELRSQCVGMERAGMELADAIDAYAAMLRRGAEDETDRRGANLDPALVTPYMSRAAEFATGMGKEFTRFIAAFESYYGAEILAARNKEKPALDLSKTG